MVCHLPFYIRGALPLLKNKYEEGKMKVYYLLSAAVASLGFMEPLKAEMPEPFNLAPCLAAAGQESNAIARCYALDDCYKTNSDTEGDWQGCIAKAELAYNEAVSGRSGVESTSAVITSPAASNYEDRDPDSKGGFMQRNEGAGR